MKAAKAIQRLFVGHMSRRKKAEERILDGCSADGRR